MKKQEQITENIELILENEDRFLSLKEIYILYKKLFDTSKFKDYTSVIRRVLYSRCIDRDLQNLDKEPLFFSLSPRKTRGNQYGLLSWINKDKNDDFSINEILNRIPNKPQFDDFIELELAPNQDISRTYKYFIRRRCMMAHALVTANYTCEQNKNHPSFIRKSNNKNYTEAHHLIPLSAQNDFKYSLDTPANIVSLCSNCHNQLHYGKYKIAILKQLYEQRISLLKKHKIYISFEKLCSYYNAIE